MRISVFEEKYREGQREEEAASKRKEAKGGTLKALERRQKSLSSLDLAESTFKKFEKLASHGGEQIGNYYCTSILYIDIRLLRPNKFIIIILDDIASIQKQYG